MTFLYLSKNIFESVVQLKKSLKNIIPLIVRNYGTSVNNDFCLLFRKIKKEKLLFYMMKMNELHHVQLQLWWKEVTIISSYFLEVSSHILEYLIPSLRKLNWFIRLMIRNSLDIFIIIILLSRLIKIRVPRLPDL